MRQSNLKKLLFLLILIKMCFGFAQNQSLKKRILIDVGHGGFDTGAIGINGLLEKEVALNIAREIIRMNKLVLDSRYDIYLTRYRDTFVSLSKRSKLASVLKADLFVALHCNKGDIQAMGMEVYIAPPSLNAKRNLKKSLMLALEVLTESNHHLYIRNRGAKFGNFQVLRETIHQCPSILIETGFISNHDEAAYYAKTSNTRAMALSILLAIHKHFKLIQ